MISRKTAVLIIFIFMFFMLSTWSFAQKNEFSLSIGGITSSDQRETISLGFPCPVGFPICNQVTSTTSAGVAIEGAFTRQLVSFGAGSLDVEFPVVGVPGRDVKLGVFGISFPPTTSMSSLFFTPSARVKFLHSSPISPFVSLGGGLAHFGTSANAAGFSISRSTNNWALQFGGGLDFKTPLPHLAFRAEVRDFYTQGPFKASSLVQLSPSRVHNIFAGGGIVLKF